MDLPGAGHVTGAERVNHLMQPVPHDMADHADEADGTE